VEDRSRLGDWEADTIIGKGRKGAIVTLVDRKSRFLRMGLVARRTKEAVSEKIISLLEDLPVHTITCDNGKEFTNHEKFSKVLISDVYFAHPYASWESGTNEKHNGILRRFIPKGNSLKDHTVQQIKQMTNWMNHLPQKVLNYKTPTESILFHFNQILGTHGSLVPS